MRGGFRLGRAAAVVLGVAVAIGFVPAPAADAATTVKVLQLNICHSGFVDCYTGDRVMTKARSVIGSTRPQVLSVNEACDGDVEPLRQAMGAARAVFVAAQRPDGTPVRCTNGQRYGNIVMVAEALAGTTGVTGRYANQDDGTERRVWACLPAGRLTACTTHLTNRSGSVALAQCRELMNRAVGYAATAPTVVAGDMNLRYGWFPNVQDCNRSGFYRKGDGSVQHVFATTNLAFVSGSRIGMDGTTDHPAWLVTVTMG
jgi:endonuclease/exonuclease/phosphatase family protein